MTSSIFARMAWVSVAAALITAPCTRASVFTIREVHSASTAIDSLSLATQLLNGTIASTGEVSANASVINFSDPQSPSLGRFGDEVPLPADAAFPGNTGRDDNDFALLAEANVVIPAAGDWTFGIRADNGFRVRVGSFLFARSGFDVSTVVQTVNFPAAGTYPLTLTYYERGGQSGVELFAAQGAVTRASSSAFRLIGDASNGGLSIAPEPAGVMPLALVGALLVRRWRRAA
jgi:hypothetical protein